MKRWQILIALTAIFASRFSSNVQAAVISTDVATLTGSIETDGHVEQIPYIDCYFDSTDGLWHIGSPGYEEFEYQTADGDEIELSGLMDPDPVLSFGLTATDAGAPSNFSFSFVLPLVPTISNPSHVFDSLSGGVTNGPAAGNVTVTALLPPAGIPQDGDGNTEVQVFTLSDDGGVTWKNVGLDAGLTTVVPLAGGASGPYGVYNQGPIPTIAGGPWTHMRADINFRLSGGGDTLTLNGAKVIVPEPGTVGLALVALGTLGPRRKRAVTNCVPA
jgi:hypothetical protein